jgi:hypothetical protein
MRHWFYSSRWIAIRYLAVDRVSLAHQRPRHAQSASDTGHRHVWRENDERMGGTKATQRSWYRLAKGLKECHGGRSALDFGRSACGRTKRATEADIKQASKPCRLYCVGRYGATKECSTEHCSHHHLIVSGRKRGRPWYVEELRRLAAPHAGDTFCLVSWHAARAFL